MTGSCVVCRSSNEPGTTYHRFPSDSKTCKEWLKILGLKSKDLKTVSRVCGRHFRSKDYSYKKRLFPNAVPLLRLKKVTKETKLKKTVSPIRHGKKANKDDKVKSSSKSVTLIKSNFKSPTTVKKCSKNVELGRVKIPLKQSTKLSRKKDVLQGKACTLSASSRPVQSQSTHDIQRKHIPKLSPVKRSSLTQRRALHTNDEHDLEVIGARRKQTTLTNDDFQYFPIKGNWQWSKGRENMVKTSLKSKSISNNKVQKRNLEHSDLVSVAKKRNISKQSVSTPSKNTKTYPQSNHGLLRHLKINSNHNVNNCKVNCNLTYIEKTIIEMQNKIKMLEQKSILDEKKIETFKNALIEQRRTDIKTLMDEKENELLLRMDLLYLEYDPKRICRLCLVLVDKKESLTSLVSHPKNEELISLIRNSTNIQIELEDGLPTGICSECLHQMKRIDWIQRKTHKSNALMKKFIMMRKNANENDNTESCSTNTVGKLSNNPLEEIEEERTEVFKIEEVFSLESSSETISFDETTIKQELEPYEDTRYVSFSQDLFSVDTNVPVKKKWTCKTCRTAFTNRWTWINHFKYCNKRFQCLECKKLFWTAQLLRYHKVRQHLCACAERLRCCYDCQIVFRWKWQLIYHVLQH